MRHWCPVTILARHQVACAASEYNELLDSIKQTLAIGQLRAAGLLTNVLVET
jgi:hypothetical protein